MSDADFPILELEGDGTVELSLEERFSTLMKIFKHQYFAVHRKIGMRFGWDVANEIAIEVAEGAVPFIADRYRKAFGLTGQDAALVSQVMQAEFQAEGSDVAVDEETSEHAQYRVLCMFGDAWQSGKFDDVQIADGLCHTGCTGWTQKLANTVHPALKVERHEWMGEGARRCRFTVTKTGNGDI